MVSSAGSPDEVATLTVTGFAFTVGAQRIANNTQRPHR
jgi:hypothetical protein